MHANLYPRVSTLVPVCNQITISIIIVVVVVVVIIIIVFI